MLLVCGCAENDSSLQVIRTLYRHLLRLPRFKGKGHVEAAYRKFFLRPHVEKVEGEVLMQLDPFEWTQVDLLQHGVIDEAVIAVLKRILRKGDCFIDAGAHVGFFSLIARKCVGGKGRVIAIDPQPYNCDRLLVNAALNDFSNIEVHIAALGAEERMIALPRQSATDSARLSLCLKPVNDQPQRFVVPLRRLDHLLRDADITAVRLLKIDVIGYELEVLRGVGEYLHNIDALLIEILDTTTAVSKALVAILRDNGFAFETIDGDSWTPDARLPYNNLVATNKR